LVNQVLTQHRVTARTYALTGLRTGSVRDQLLRSTLLACALREANLIGPGAANKLLVLGAGASGMNLAIQAAELGVSVDVLELEATPFNTLYKASWRRIDPVEYDWPHAHYQRGVFPGPTSGRIPLQQITGTGAALARNWNKAWKDWDANRNGRQTRGTVEIFTRFDATLVKPLNETAVAVNVSPLWRGSAGAATVPYGAVVSCIGFAGELTRHHPPPDRWSGYHGPQFWTDDDRLHEHWVQPLDCRQVLISGGGDGGMQDFQRAATAAFGKKLLDNLISEAAIIAPNWIICPDRTTAAIVKADDIGRRAFAWRQDGQTLAQTQTTWDDAFRAEAIHVIGLLSSSQTIALAGKILRPCIVSGATALTWIHREATPGFAYALNRYLAIFVELLAHAVSAAVEVLPRSEIVAMSPKDPPHAHLCGDPDHCFGKMHKVTLKASNGVELELDADCIIVRHGALQTPLLGTVPMPEQMTPYDFPQ